jgi:hypothetical protein
VIVSVVVIVVGLNFFPALLLGPIVQGMTGQLFWASRTKATVAASSATRCPPRNRGTSRGRDPSVDERGDRRRAIGGSGELRQYLDRTSFRVACLALPSPDRNCTRAIQEASRDD